MDKHSKKEYSVQCVENALDLLEMFNGKEIEFGVSALSRRLNLPKNKVFRILSTLKARNYIEQNQHTENYRLGWRTVELRHAFVRHMKRFDSARPLMEAFSRECNETVCYSVLDKFSVITLDKVDCAHVYQVSPQVGALSPSYCTAAGKALMSMMPDEDLDSFFSCQKLKQYTPFTITDRTKLREQLQEISSCGYAVARDEMLLGMSSIGTVIRDHTFKTVGAVSVVAPSERLSNERLSGELIPQLLDVAAGISGKLGFYSSGFDPVYAV